MRLSILALMILFFSTQPVFALKIGYVDLRKVIARIHDGKVAKAKLKKIRAKYQKHLNKRRKQLEKARNLYMKRRPLLRGAAKRREEEKLQKMLLKTQQNYKGMMQKLRLAEARAMQTILRKMQVVLAKIVQKHHINLMLEKNKSSLLYAKKGLDYTKELVKGYEKRFGKNVKRKRRKKKRRKRRQKTKKR